MSKSAFKKDLKALLNKHNACLVVMVEGDTHGIHDEGIGVSFMPEKPNRHGHKIWSDAEYITEPEMNLMAKDL